MFQEIMLFKSFGGLKMAQNKTKTPKVPKQNTNEQNLQSLEEKDIVS